MPISTIAAVELPRLLDEGHTLIDVRAPAEYKSAHVDGANSTPLDSLNSDKFAHNGSGKPIYILCQTGKRARIAAEKLEKAGLKHPVVVEGGTLAAIEAGVPILRGRRTISIERQVRIAAGSLVFIGSMLGLFVSPGFFGIPAFIGAGLVFAGITDTCGMGMMLTQCPWNR